MLYQIDFFCKISLLKILQEHSEHHDKATGDSGQRNALPPGKYGKHNYDIVG
jgi:hypothetical protein